MAPTPAATVMKMTRSNRIAKASAKGVLEVLSKEASKREVSMELSNVYVRERRVVPFNNNVFDLGMSP
jgi:hypothetical protein